ncbi:MAG: hypothetical protein GY822_11860 [Deltaproteobacteria bacterium]|nr:hypothetical protein [Deltaproteobacteria bacterium]
MFGVTGHEGRISTPASSLKSSPASAGPASEGSPASFPLELTSVGEKAGEVERLAAD